MKAANLTALAVAATVAAAGMAYLLNRGVAPELSPGQSMADGGNPQSTSGELPDPQPSSGMRAAPGGAGGTNRVPAAPEQTALSALRTLEVGLVDDATAAEGLLEALVAVDQHLSQCPTIQLRLAVHAVPAADRGERWNTLALALLAKHAPDEAMRAAAERGRIAEQMTAVLLMVAFASDRHESLSTSEFWTGFLCDRGLSTLFGEHANVLRGAAGGDRAGQAIGGAFRALEWVAASEEMRNLAERAARCDGGAEARARAIEMLPPSSPASHVFWSAAVPDERLPPLVRRAGFQCLTRAAPREAEPLAEAALRSSGAPDLRALAASFLAELERDGGATRSANWWADEIRRLLAMRDQPSLRNILGMLPIRLRPQLWREYLQVATVEDEGLKIAQADALSILYRDASRGRLPAGFWPAMSECWITLGAEAKATIREALIDVAPAGTFP